MRKKYAVLSLTMLLLAAMLTGCAGGPEPAAPAATAAPQEERVTLTVAGSWPDFRALDVAGRAFTAKYPNCTIVYEYLQDYYPSLEKRMSGEDPIDLFATVNIQPGSDMLPYALDLYGREELNLNDTFDGLIENFLFRGDGEGKKQLYALPLGAEMRGLYVNKTLLESLGLSVPQNRAELLAACQSLKEHGYIPFHGNPGDFSQLLMYPWVCSLVANAEDPEAARNAVAARGEGVVELLREPFSFLYDLVENDYYDYKRAQTELGLFTETTDEAYARDFLNIRAQGDTWEKADDLGQVAFMPSPMSRESVIAKTKDDYHSGIEYVFIPAPVGEAGGYVYLSPAHGIAVNKNSPNTVWALRFLDFLFQPENNEDFARAFNVIPNTKEAFSYIRTRFDVPDERISHLGQVTFDYDFYAVVCSAMVDISKGNNPKYMLADGAGNLSLYPFEHYMDETRKLFAGQ